MAEFKISKEDTRKIQMVGLQILLFFNEFCQKHELKWFFCGGCCIGTVRNQGFIPWDDDVDVFMPRQDYEKLKEFWINTNEYSIQYPTKEKKTENPFVTIHDNRTTFIKSYQKNLDINHGIAIDVFPIDGCPQGWKRKTQKIWALLYSLYVVGKAPKKHGKMIEIIGEMMLALVPVQGWRDSVWRFCERKMSQYSISSCQYITELCAGPHYMQNEYPKCCFEEPVQMEFEGYMLNMPSDYDTYLKMAFGNYRQLPPEEKRICHHEHEFIDLDHGYREYRGKKYFVKNI